MIRLKRPRARGALRKATQDYLARRQETANTYPPGTAQINRAWNDFLRTNARRDVEQALHEFCLKKCVYCEALVPKDIEHFYPKSKYPKRMFRWTNFVRGCKNCNNAKLDRFPKAGNRRLLIDPCSDEPLDYLVFDPTTGRAMLNPDPRYHDRAKVTRDMFGLDEDTLCDERRIKLSLVTSLLARVVRENPINDATIDGLRDELLPTRPRLGIVRALFKRPDYAGGRYRTLVAGARKKLPAIDQWLGEWI